MRGIFNSWRYYTIGQDAYKESLDRQYPSNLASMALSGVIFFLFSIFAIVNWRTYGIIEAILFPLLAVSSILFAVAAIVKHKGYKNGKQVSNRFIFCMMLVSYIVVMISSIYIDILLSPTAVAVIFMTLLAGGVLLLPANAVLSLFMNLGVLALYVIASLVFVTPDCCWVCELGPVTFGVVVAISFSWYANMHKMIAQHKEIELEKERDQYRTQSTLDELTGISNRRAFVQRFERYLKNSRGKDNFLCCAIIDIDYFKNYNDHYGHVMGDNCLRQIGAALSEPFEISSVFPARIGGEEFALVWLDEEKDGYKSIISQVQKRVTALEIPHEKSKVSQYLTVSIGAYIVPSDMQNDQTAMYNLADNMLYEAKNTGRNRAFVSCGDGEQFVLLP
ncbi:MAG: diguanylate cyclase [Defluviitaleaceae bacterium]|nr:diguanylate cyclase [Defluviitaleaceae bacterium]